MILIRTSPKENTANSQIIKKRKIWRAIIYYLQKGRKIKKNGLNSNVNTVFVSRVATKLREGKIEL